MIRIFFSCLFIFSLFHFNQAHGQSAYEVSIEVMANVKTINTMYFELTKTERIKGEYETETFKTKLVYEPFMLYSKKQEIGKAPELLYKDGWNDNKCYVNPDGFPWFNLDLDPLGFVMRRNQHHTMYQTGYRYAMSILEHLFSKYGDEVEKMSFFLPEDTVDNHACYVIEYTNYNYAKMDYTVQEGENLNDIASKFMLSEFKILEEHKEIDDYDDVKAGQVLHITNDYCPRMIMRIEKERMIPISIEVFDEKGLYERLEYFNVIVNPDFKDEEFTTSYPNYGF